MNEMCLFVYGVNEGVLGHQIRFYRASSVCFFAKIIIFCACRTKKYREIHDLGLNKEE